MNTPPKTLIDQCLFIDLETGKDGKIYHLGACLGETTFEERLHGDGNTAMSGLECFGSTASFLAGHNIIGHDLPYLTALKPETPLLGLPVIDTLYLSPLAFPENPYHRLVKNYKRVRTSINDPMQDALLTARILSDQMKRFFSMDNTMIDFYRSCFSGCSFPESAVTGKGIADVFEACGGRELSGSDEAQSAFSTLSRNKVCSSALKAVFAKHWNLPDKRIILAYSLAWLSVSGGNSVLPPWIRKRFPECIDLLHRLREAPCTDATCGYCDEIHDPVKHLTRFFGYPSYRKLPDGTPLQEKIVSCGLDGRPHLGILPTGGGKSICFQVPALAGYLKTNALTVVISPLQALMKDQVDNLNANTGSEIAATINGLLTPPERGKVMDQVMMGDTGILYLSPEQLRNRSIRTLLSSRQIRCWVFDEAHCLSKWGHDFRPDYLYASRFIRNFSKKESTEPSVACFTATAKRDVIKEIVDHFKMELGLDLELFEGGVERDNLTFDVRTVTAHQKTEALHEILSDEFKEGSKGAAIIYCATRKATEKIAEYLVSKGWKARCFHAGMTPPEKREVQEAFIRGDIPLITATNAFGMGIDKENVRLVIHADIPGSLENYLQEAGRAGRDNNPARCILLYDEEDIEDQFRLSSFSRLTIHDINQILKGIRRARKNRDGNIVITAGEIIRDDTVTPGFDATDYDYETRIKTAVSWLERGEFLSREENITSVFQGRPRFTSLSEAEEKLSGLNLSAMSRQIWATILRKLINAPQDQGMSADQICESLGAIPDLPEEYNQTKTVIAVMNDMAESGLIERSMMLSAWLKKSGAKNAHKLLADLQAIETCLLRIMEEEYPIVDEMETLQLTFRAMNQKLLDRGIDNAGVELVKQLLKTIERDGRGFGNTHSSLEIFYQNRDLCRLRMKRDWPQIKKISRRRHDLAALLIQAIINEVPERDRQATEVLVRFSYDRLVQTLESSISTIEIQPGKMLSAIEAGLLFLHDYKIISLQQGLAVFRQAMTLKLNPDTIRKRYKKSDFQPLAHHYSQRIFQIHIMNEFARMGAEKIRQALDMIMAYFSMDTLTFIKTFFSNRKELLERATSEESFKTIVSSLSYPAQERIVTSDETANILVLAGPGSGKTRTVVHRCAWLLRVKRVRPGSVLCLCYNHSAATMIRKRLFQLAGKDARGVSVMTFHSLALQITGRTPEALTGTSRNDDQEISEWFNNSIVEASQILTGKKRIPGIETGSLRERILAGYRHILVDEYQDIDEDQYTLISAIAGRSRLSLEEKMSIMAVGDDDQSIYGFRNASVRFIRKFKHDYAAEIHYLTRNYRSESAIIDLANHMIQNNTDRMKAGQPGRPADRNRNDVGEIRLYPVRDTLHQAERLAHEIKTLMARDPGLDPTRIAVLSRNGFDHDMLVHARERLEYDGLPVSIPLPRNASFSLFRVREIHHFLESLDRSANEPVTVPVLLDRLPAKGRATSNVWQQLILDTLSAFRSQTGDAEVHASEVRHYLRELLIDRKREQRLGRGIFLGTAHSAKGLEFSHLFILDGGWRRPVDIKELEEERRLYYVAMTRAQHFLGLFSLSGQPNPHLEIISGHPGISKMPTEFSTSPFRPDATIRHELISMKDLFLDYAGRRAPSHPIHTALTGLEPDDCLIPKKSRSGVVFCTENGVPVVSTAREAADKWSHLIPRIKHIRVIALIRRRAADAAPEFKSWIKTPEWEVPLMEAAILP